MITTPELLQESAQVARVATKVPRWLAQVPLYQRLSPHSRCPDRESDFLSCFRALPIISKREIRSGFPRNFLPAGVDLEGLLDRELVELERTSGTSEEPTPLLLAHGWWAEQEHAALSLNRQVANALHGHARRVTIASPVCNSEICYTGTPSPADRVAGKTLFANLSRHPFLWSSADLDRMVDETLAWQPVFLDVDPVYGALLARHCARQGIRLPSLKFIISSYEFLSAVHRRQLQQALGVPVFNLYGSTETGHLLMETEHGEMAPSLTTAFLEVLHPDTAGIGTLVVTTLTNHYMPLIRYNIGDLVRVNLQPYHTTYEVHGRAKDALVNTRGQRVTVAQVDQCLAHTTGLIHYQLRQQSADQFTLYVVPETPGTAEPTLVSLRPTLAELLGTDRGLTIEPVEYIPCESSGKFRLCCRI